jgi:hypothetical protein
MIYLTAVGLTPGGSSTVHSYTQTIHRITQLIYIFFIFNCNWVATRWQLFSTYIHTNNTGNVTKQTSHRTTQKKLPRTKQKCIEQHKKYIEQQKKLGRVQAVPRLCGFYPGICLTTEEKARKNLSQGSHT